LTKFNNKKKRIDGHLFDSEMEADYYIELLRKQKAGGISKIDLQPSFLLQEGFKKGEKNYKPITYVADFLVTYHNGKQDVIDVKTEATVTEVFKIKRKLFEKRYPELTITLITKTPKKYGDMFIELEKLIQLKKQEGAKNNAKAKSNSKTKGPRGPSKKIKGTKGQATYTRRKPI
jgi:hypothetical protein